MATVRGTLPRQRSEVSPQHLRVTPVLPSLIMSASSEVRGVNRSDYARRRTFRSGHGCTSSSWRCLGDIGCGNCLAWRRRRAARHGGPTATRRATLGRPDRAGRLRTSPANLVPGNPRLRLAEFAPRWIATRALGAPALAVRGQSHPVASNRRTPRPLLRRPNQQITVTPHPLIVRHGSTPRSRPAPRKPR
jgi:hypothetical protein